MRRHREEEYENHDRWLVSYADFITLLFAFFVVMYAVSSVNEGKYRVLSDTLDSAFKARERSASVVNIGAPARTVTPSPDTSHPGTDAGEPTPGVELELEEIGRTPTGTDHEFVPKPEVMAQKVQEALAELVKKGIVTVSEGGEWVEVEMKSQVLFDSGRAKLKKDAAPVLTEVAQAVSRFTNGLQVEGYTDNTPIATAAFASNWELSAARAASVVQLFSAAGVEPARLAAVGYGEYRPKAGNDTPEGRQQNRRVVVRISTRAKDKVSTGAPSPDSGVAPGAMKGTAPTATPGAATSSPPPAKPGEAELKSITDRPGREGPDH